MRYPHCTSIIAATRRGRAKGSRRGWTTQDGPNFPRSRLPNRDRRFAASAAVCHFDQRRCRGSALQLPVSREIDSLLQKPVTRMGKMEQVEWEDVQGLLRDGLLRLPYAAYILWRCKPENV